MNLKNLICLDCKNYKCPSPFSSEFVPLSDQGCSLGRILPTKKNQCNKYLARVQDKKHGGPRAGAGRPKLADKKKVCAFALSPQVIDFLNTYSRSNNLSKSEAVESIIKSCI